MSGDDLEVRRATTEDADEIAQLLHDFNSEFGAASPGPPALAARLRTLLSTSSTYALLAGTPAVAVALVTLRTNVWYEGKVALLDELFVIPNLRDRGIGTAVMSALLSTAPEIGIDAVEINVDEGDLDCADRE